MRGFFGGGHPARLAGTLIGTIAAFLAIAAPAAASFHLMMIQEVFPGSTANPGQDYVTLQMYAPGQNFVGGHSLTVYAANGTVAHTAAFPPAPGGNVANGHNQDTILIGAANSVVGVAPDLVDSGLAAMDPAGGAVCWESIDCVSWGSFTPPLAGLPSPAGTPVSFSPDGSITRNTNVGGCTTALDPPDDTNDGSDFAGGLPVPRNNATPPTEELCPNTQITAGPTNPTHDRTPTFKFKSSPPGAPTFFCGTDNVPQSSWSSCESPVTLPKLSFGKHKFFVEAVNSINGADPTPAKQAFKVVRRR